MKRNNFDFIKKISLINSQENNEEIVWSNSSSSDIEGNSEMNLKKHSKKRKRKQIKKLFTNSISDFDVTISDSSEEKPKSDNTSPILKPSLRNITFNCYENNSPIIETENQQPHSPVFAPTTIKQRSKSPILVLQSKENNPNVCKRLFYGNVKKDCNFKKKCISSLVNEVSYERSISPIFEPRNECLSNENHYCLKNKTNLELVEKVKTYFHRSLSTDSLSQHSISEYSTPKNSSKTSDEVEIIDFTQGLPPPIKLENSPHKEHSAVKSKKIKYKKGGLAYRLDNLLKKQKANISLWQHEQYLATNSNHTFPKEPFLAFRIKKVDCKFGCYLILAISDKDEVFYILINNLFVREKMALNFILKLYEPYKTLEFNEKCKLIVNVCKFSCEPLRTN